MRRPWKIRLGNLHRIWLHPHSTVPALVLYYRLPEYAEMSFLRAYLQPGDLFVDVGANVGVYSLLASETPEVEVLGFEPSSHTHRRAVENIELNDLGSRVNIIQAAVGSEEGSVLLTRGLDAINHVVAKDDSDRSAEQVRLTTLDQELASRVPALLKIDVEGHELHALRGALATIAEHRPALIIEVNDPTGLTAMMREIGYEMWSYEPATRSLTPALPLPNGNVIALPDVEAARSRLRRSSPAAP